VARAAGDYGGIGYADCVMADGLPTALALAWRSDNAGPPESVDEVGAPRIRHSVPMWFEALSVLPPQVLATWRDLRATFPAATTVRAATFEDFEAELKNVRASLPLFANAELGNTWAYGDAADPHRVAAARALERVRAQYTGDRAAPSFLNFTRFLLKFIEHTNGVDVKTALDASNKPEYYAWNNSAFAAARTHPGFAIMEESWAEQWRMQIDYALEALPQSSSLLAAARAALDELRPAGPPSTAGMQRVEDADARLFACGAVSLGFANATGAIRSLRAGSSSADWASTGRPFGLYQYQTLDSLDFEEFFAGYLYIDPRSNSWAGFDLGKVNVSTDARTWRSYTAPKLESLWASADGCAFVTHGVMDASVVLGYGAPTDVWVTWHVDAASLVVSATITLLGKQPTRLPEAQWFSFLAPESLADSHWVLNVNGFDVNQQNLLTNASTHLYGVGGGVRLETAAGSLKLGTMDAAVVSLLGDFPSPFPTPLYRANATPSTPSAAGASFCLSNNVWGTNFAMYTPWSKEQEDAGIAYRFTLQLPRA
jgi:hypothetical protein